MAWRSRACGPPTDRLQFSVNYTYLDPEIDQVDAPAGTIFDPAFNPLSPYQVGDNVAEVFALPYTSENSVNASVDWTFLELGTNAFSAHVNYRWQDRFLRQLTDRSGRAESRLLRDPVDAT